VPSRTWRNSMRPSIAAARTLSSSKPSTPSLAARTWPASSWIRAPKIRGTGFVGDLEDASAAVERARIRSPRSALTRARQASAAGSTGVRAAIASKFRSAPSRSPRLHAAWARANVRLISRPRAEKITASTSMSGPGAGDPWNWGRIETCGMCPRRRAFGGVVGAVLSPRWTWTRGESTLQWDDRSMPGESP